MGNQQGWTHTRTHMHTHSHTHTRTHAHAVRARVRTDPVDPAGSFVYGSPQTDKHSYMGSRTHKHSHTCRHGAKIEVCTGGRILWEIDNAIGTRRGRADMELRSRSVQEGGLSGKSTTLLAPGGGLCGKSTRLIAPGAKIEVCTGGRILLEIDNAIGTRREHADKELRSRSVREDGLCGKSITLLAPGGGLCGNSTRLVAPGVDMQTWN